MAANFSKVAGAGRIYVDLPETLEKALANWLASLEKSAVFLKCAGQIASDFRKVGSLLACAICTFIKSETNL